MAHQKRQRELEAKRSKLRRELFARQDEVESQRNDPAFNRRMRTLYDAYVKKFSDAGFPPYRTNPGAQDLLAAQFSFNNNVLLKFQSDIELADSEVTSLVRQATRG